MTLTTPLLKRIVFPIIAIITSLIFIEVCLHLLTFFNILSSNRIITPWFYQGSDAKFAFDKNGSPVFVNGDKAYIQVGIPPHPQAYDTKGYRPTDTKRFEITGHRIGFFGDSYTEGLQVADTETFPRLVEEAFRLSGEDKLCFNFGVGGTGTYHQYLRYLTVSEDIDLDHVIVFFLPLNDVLNNHERLGKPFELYNSPYLTVRQGQYEELIPLMGRELPSEVTEISLFRVTVGSSFIARAFYYGPRMLANASLFAPKKQVEDKEMRQHLTHTGENVWTTIRASWLDVYSPPQSKDWEEAWAVTEETLRRFATTARNNQTRFTLVLVADVLQITFDGGEGRDWAEGYDLSYPNKRLMAFCQQNGLECYDSLPYFLARKATLEPPYFSWDHDGHYSQIGHTTMSDFLLESVFH